MGQTDGDRRSGEARYEIVVKGHLGSVLLGWFDQLEVGSWGPDFTCLSGWFADQAALHGVLRQMADLGLELRSVRRLTEPG